MPSFSGGVVHAVQLQVQIEPVLGQVFCWYDGRKIFRWTFGAENIRPVRAGRQGQIQISNHNVYESTCGKTGILFRAF